MFVTAPVNRCAQGLKNREEGAEHLRSVATRLLDELWTGFREYAERSTEAERRNGGTEQVKPLFQTEYSQARQVNTGRA
jgi:type III secretory pathway component EscR